MFCMLKYFKNKRTTEILSLLFFRERQVKERNEELDAIIQKVTYLFPVTIFKLVTKSGKEKIFFICGTHCSAISIVRSYFVMYRFLQTISEYNIGFCLFKFSWDSFTFLLDACQLIHIFTPPNSFRPKPLKKRSQENESLWKRPRAIWWKSMVWRTRSQNKMWRKKKRDRKRSRPLRRVRRSWQHFFDLNFWWDCHWS